MISDDLTDMGVWRKEVINASTDCEKQVWNSEGCSVTGQIGSVNIFKGRDSGCGGVLIVT